MKSLTIRKELHRYIDTADDASIEAMYINIKNEVNEPYEWYNDEKLLAELERRSADLESGIDKGFTEEESKKQLLARLHKNG